MNAQQRTGLVAVLVGLAACAALGQTERRSAYSYVRETSGDVTVISGLNGTVEARRNLPISPGDEVRTDDPGRAEIALADGNVLHVGGGTSVQFVSLYAQQGSDDDVSALSLKEGSILLSVVGNDDKAVPRIDTEDVAVYTNPGARVRVNADPRRGTAVVVRAGSVEVRTPAGSYTVRAGNYLLAHGEEEPEVARGSFSRDRFDSWAADRLAATYDAPRNASSQYVGEDYSSDVASLDGYGNWDYNSTYSSYVWRPQVASGWTPYSNGSWYYTPAGLTWWSLDSWGWYPFHYGNWFFDSGWNSWCWSPGYVYSPAWVYWGYTSGYVGWCPMGNYGGYNSPWWDNYYRNWSYPRNSLAFAINGNYSTRRVDMRGWNFTGTNGFGTTRGRVDVIPGTRVVDRLGDRIAVSSRPIVLGARTGAGVRDSMRDYVREAPRVIERTAGHDADRLEPVLAHDRELPRSTVEAMRGRSVVAERGRLSGPGAQDLAPRGATIVERGRGPVSIESTKRIETDRTTGRTVLRDGGRAPAMPVPDRGAHPESRHMDTRTEPVESWRTRSGAGESGGRAATEAPRNHGEAPAGQSWRGNPRTTQPQAGQPAGQAAGQRSESQQRTNSEDWRSRGQVPPARRVIEGAVPGRRNPDSGSAPQRSNDFGARESPARGSAPHSVDRAATFAFGSAARVLGARSATRAAVQLGRTAAGSPLNHDP
jgi:FecR protein